MPFRFQSEVDAFLELLGPNRTLEPSDYDRYFGKMLSKTLIKKLQDRPISLETWAPKAWSLALETALSKESRDSMDTLLEETKALAASAGSDIFQPVSKASGHLSWNFFGDCGSALLSKLSTAMKNMERLPLKILKSFVNTEIHFQGLGYFHKTNKEGVLYLKPKPESLKAIHEIQEELRSHLGFSEKAPFIPHVTLGRIKENQKFETILKPGLENLWNPETLSLYPDHFMLYRHLDHFSHQGVFGLVWQ